MADSLTAAVNAADLPSLIAEDFPESGARPGKGGAFKAVWRGDRNPSGSLWKNDNGTWMFKDHGEGEAGTAFDYLTTVLSLSAAEAAQRLKAHSGIGHEAEAYVSQRASRATVFAKPIRECKSEPIEETRAKAHHTAVATLERPPLVLEGRGFSLEMCKALMIASDGPDALLAITGPMGDIVSIKRRRYQGKPKYTYEVSGHGAPAWCSPGITEREAILVVEGELNGMVLSLALTEYGVMGVAGAENHLQFNALKGKRVYVYADADGEGEKAQERWCAEALAIGAREVYKLARTDADAADILQNAGLEGVAEVYRKKLGRALRVEAETEDDPLIEAPVSVDITIANHGYALVKERKVGKEHETYYEPLTNWTFTPTLTLIYPGGARGERGVLKINGAQSFEIDIPAKAWGGRRDILEAVGVYDGQCFTNSGSDIAKIRQWILLHYADLPKATGATSYGLHIHGGKWLELYENDTVGEFATPPLFFAGTPVDPGSVAFAAPRTVSSEAFAKARDAIPRLQSLTTRTTALAVTGYAIASAFAPRILMYQGGKMPFIYTTGEREAGKSTFIELNLEMVTGDRHARFKLAPGMSTYQYDVAFSRANNSLAVLDEFKPGMIDDELLRKHHHLDVKWRGSGVAAKDHSYPLNSPLIVAGEGFTEDPASLSRGALYFFEKKDRGKLEHYNYLTQVPWRAFAPYLHEQVRALPEDKHRARIARADALSRQAAATLNPRLVFALRFIAYGLLALQDEFGAELYPDHNIIATLAKGAENTLSGGEEGITNLELFLEQLGSVASQIKDSESVVTPGATTGDVVIRIGNAVELVKDRYRERSAISNARMVKRLAVGTIFCAEGDVHKDYKGNTIRGLRIHLNQIPERCDAGALEYLEQKMRAGR